MSPPTRLIHYGTPEFRRVNWGLFAAGVATFSLLYSTQPLLPEFSRAFGVSEAVSALSLSLSTLVLAFALMAAGALSDRWGRKPVMVASTVSSALLVLASALAPNWGSLLVVRTLLGVTLSGVPAVAMAYLSEEVDAASIGLGMGLYISGNAIGGLSGRLIAGLLVEYIGWRWSTALVGLVGLACSLAFWRLLPASRHFQRRPVDFRALASRSGEIFRDSGLRWLLIQGFVLASVLVTIYNFIGYRLLAAPYNLSQALVGAIFLLYIVGIFSSPWVGGLASRFGHRKVLWPMFALMLAGVAITALAPLWLVIFGIAAMTFGFFGGHSTASSWVGLRASPAAKAQATSLYMFCFYMGSSLAGAYGGVFYAARGWGGVVVFVGLIALLGLATALRLARLQDARSHGDGLLSDHGPPTP